MAGRLDHIGIAVPDLEEAVELYSGLLGLELERIEEVPREKVRVAFLKLSRGGGAGHVELLEPLDDDCNIARFIARKGPGLHHLAFSADDIEAALRNCRAAGLQLIDETPAAGAGGKRIVFLHPKSTGSVLVEICSGGH
ncbi:methylmalonyl-CoA epimerase [bacterium]|nr:methylmalonyl-CoA epimerase [bacterium]MBU1074359.1 methylmalonyl-CoA epimerase [bacterium]MBU1676345.1 methylmalonyl-CoA epimerase [bacterium]